MTEDALAAQIQGLLDNAQRHLDAPVVSQPAPARPAEDEPEQDMGDFASPQEILDQTAMPAPTHVEPDEQGIEASATEQDTASVTKLTPAPADPRQASTPGDDAEVARILEQIDDDLSMKADEAVSGEFETVLDVVGSPKDAAGQESSASDESHQASGDYATAEQVAAELDSQPDANSNASDHAATPIPAIPDEAMAKAAAPAPASPQAAQPKSSASKAAANSAPADASATKRKLSLRLPSPIPALRAVMTLVNAPLINANPSIRQAVGLLGLGNLMLGSFWVIWLLISRH
ncbi:MAG: hypothetical protein HC898_10540 [Phycisphaerales bacterium]|nr:hypothetical protein [Phycisphaerales bacterium]